jgi:hypothetical protein
MPCESSRGYHSGLLSACCFTDYVWFGSSTALMSDLIDIVLGESVVERAMICRCTMDFSSSVSSSMAVSLLLVS